MIIFEDSTIKEEATVKSTHRSTGPNMTGVLIGNIRTDRKTEGQPWEDTARRQPSASQERDFKEGITPAYTLILDAQPPELQEKYMSAFNATQL